VGTGNGLLGWIAYIGAACAGEPVAHVVKSFGWGAWFWLLLGSCAAGGALLAPFWSVRTYEDLALPSSSR
jgi:OPA family sugar phosphate sensor protein UhpC-like MFS transporter